MSTPAPGLDLTDPVFARLEDQINWYDGKSIAQQRTFKTIKVIEDHCCRANSIFVGAESYRPEFRSGLCHGRARRTHHGARRIAAPESLSGKLDQLPFDLRATPA